jgi:hypothetical protein
VEPVSKRAKTASKKIASAKDCRPLFPLMNQIHDMAPWDWMEETEIFGVQDPATGELGFVSIMGMAGEHYAIGVYQGVRGLYGFWNMQERGPAMQPEDLLNVPQLQASFEDRDMLDQTDYKMIKSLKLKYRGRNAWPQFRSYRPGYAPWYLEPGEARFLQHVLGQVLEVAPRVEEDPDILEPEGDNAYLVRVAEQDGDSLTWRDEIMTIGPPEAEHTTIEIDPKLIDTVRQLPRAEYAIEVDCFMLPSMIQERQQRPYFPYVFMMMDADRGIIINTEMLSPLPSLEQMWGQIGLHVLRNLAKVGAVPAEIRVSNSRVYAMLIPFARELDLNLKEAMYLPMLEDARDNLENFLSRR